VIVIKVEGDLSRVVEKIKEKYKFEETQEPLLSEKNILYMMWRIKGLIWHEIRQDLGEYDECDLPLYVDRLFDEISTVSDTWLNVLTSFNTKCLQYINNKKVLEMIIDILVLRNVYYELRKIF
jgi:hypothetical protein